MVSTRRHTEPEAAHEESTYPVFPQCLQYRWWREHIAAGESPQIRPKKEDQAAKRRQQAPKSDCCRRFAAHEINGPFTPG